MNLYQRAIKYTKPSSEIDEKICRLNEMMTTNGMYTVVDTDPGREEIQPTFEPAPLGAFADLDNFSWADQGDGSSDTANLSQLKTTDVDGIQQLVLDMPDLDYPSGTAYAMAFGPNQAVTGNSLGYISDSGFVFVYQVNNVFSVQHTDFSRAFVEAYEAGTFVQKTIYLWGPLLYRVTTPITASQYYPSDRNFDTTPKADKGLYAYNLLIPTTNGNVKRNDVKTDDGVRARGPSVTSVISRDNLGDPNYYPGPATNVSPEAINYLLSRIPPYVGRPPRNSPGPGPQNVQGPHQPIKYYPGMGFGPAGPVQPGGFYANSYEPEGEVLSEDLTKNDFARLNKYVKDHPEELEYAFKRYPASDPRLSKLNWKMDDMMNASNEYVEKHPRKHRTNFKSQENSGKKY